MPWRKPPRVDFEEQAGYRWPFWKIDGLKEEDLFGDLHERFNTAPMFIQDPDAFHHDVDEIVHQSLDKEDFYARLQERRDQRLDELKKMQDKIGTFLHIGYSLLDKNQSFRHLRLELYASLDCLIAFCASFLGPNENGTMPSLDIFMRSEERNARNRQHLLPILATSPKPSTTDASDPEHAELPLSSPHADRKCTPSTTLDADSSKPSPDLRGGESRPRKRKRKHPADSDGDDSLPHNRLRNEPPEAPEQSEAHLLRATEDANGDYDHASSPQHDAVGPEKSAGQKTSIPPTGDHRAHSSAIVNPNSAKGHATGRRPRRPRLRSGPGTGRGNRRKPDSTQPTTEDCTQERAVGQNRLSPQRRSAHIAARSRKKEK